MGSHSVRAHGLCLVENLNSSGALSGARLHVVELPLVDVAAGVVFLEMAFVAVWASASGFSAGRKWVEVRGIARYFDVAGAAEFTEPGQFREHSPPQRKFLGKRFDFDQWHASLLPFGWIVVLQRTHLL